MNFNYLYNNGFQVVKIKNLSYLKKIKLKIYDLSIRIERDKYKNIDKYFDHFHKIIKDSTILNEFRIELISKINSNNYIRNNIFKSFENELLNILGPDIAVQKNVNLSVNLPKDLNVVPIHRDAPPSSNFDLAIVIPLTTFFNSKNLYVLNLKDTYKSLKLYSKNEKRYKSFSIKNAKKLSIKFGQILVFWPGLKHMVPYNLENESRWSLNIRFKNIFSPYGSKDFLDFYEIIKLSKFTKMNLDFQKKLITSNK